MAQIQTLEHVLFALKIGDVFSTDGDGGKCSYRVKRFIKMLPYNEKDGYAVQTVSHSATVEVVDVKFSKKHHYISGAAAAIGMCGGVWYLQLI
jgi:hypothetical protein